MKIRQSSEKTESTATADLVSVEFICSGCGKTLPLVAPEDMPQRAREVAMNLGWTFESDAVTHGVEAFCSDCSGARERLRNEGGASREAGAGLMDEQG